MAQVSARPVRYKGADGAWRDFDLDLVPGQAPGAALAPRGAPGAARLAPASGAAVATLVTPAGDVVLRHPGAAPARATVEGPKATYARALPGGRDLTLEALPEGVKETVTLSDAKGPSSYTAELVLPPGVTARQAVGGVELVDRGGTVLATYGGGVAYDSAQPPALVPVNVGLVGRAGPVAQVEVGVDSAWLRSPSRQFPVQVDPDLTRQTCSGCGGRTHLLMSGNNAATAIPEPPWLTVGTNNGDANRYRSLLWFDVGTSTLPSGWTLVQADLWLGDMGVYADCTPKGLYMAPLAGPFSAATTWNSQPPVDPTGPFTYGTWRRAWSSSGLPCAGPAWQAIDATVASRSWLSGAGANHGLMLIAENEWYPPMTNDSYKAFYGSPSCCPPTLWLRWTREITQPLAEGLEHSLAVKANGTVYAYGRNDFGQLGNGTAASVPGALVPGVASVVSVAAGDAHSLALRSEGTVLAWGRNDSGQLGDGWTSGAPDQPYTASPVEVLELRGVKAIAAGCAHSLALAADGTVWAWGDNTSGQLGVAGGGYVPVRVKVAGLAAITAVAAGCGWSMALGADGRVWAWGANTAGQLGDGTATGRYWPAPVSGLSGVSAIGAGRYHALAVTGGAVRAWGANSSGQLGNGSTGGSAWAPVPVLNLGGAVAVAGGSTHSVVLLGSGAVWAFGANASYQLGTNTQVPSAVPVQVRSSAAGAVLVGVAGIAAGGNHASSVGSNGQVKKWGDHSDGTYCVYATDEPAPTPAVAPRSVVPPTATANVNCPDQTPTPAATYGTLDSVGRATSASRALNAAVLRPGTPKPDVNLDPVGFAAENRQDRSHLLAYIFGGRTTRAEYADLNIVALFREANQEPFGMRRYERLIQVRLVSMCETINYSATPVYGGPSPCSGIQCAPTGVLMVATGDKGYRLNCLVENSRNPPVCPA